MMLQCRECKERMSWTSASRCPFCGAENPLGYSRGAKWFWIFLFFILLGGFAVWFEKVLEGLARIDDWPR